MESGLYVGKETCYDKTVIFLVNEDVKNAITMKWQGNNIGYLSDQGDRDTRNVVKLTRHELFKINEFIIDLVNKRAKEDQYELTKELIEAEDKVKRVREQLENIKKVVY